MLKARAELHTPALPGVLPTPASLVARLPPRTCLHWAQPLCWPLPLCHISVVVVVVGLASVRCSVGHPAVRPRHWLPLTCVRVLCWAARWATIATSVRVLGRAVRLGCTVARLATIAASTIVLVIALTAAGTTAGESSTTGRLKATGQQGGGMPQAQPQA